MDSRSKKAKGSLLEVIFSDVNPHQGEPREIKEVDVMLVEVVRRCLEGFSKVRWGWLKL